jgi:hypothetical protein
MLRALKSHSRRISERGPRSGRVCCQVPYEDFYSELSHLRIGGEYDVALRQRRVCASSALLFRSSDVAADADDILLAVEGLMQLSAPHAAMSAGWVQQIVESWKTYSRLEVGKKYSLVLTSCPCGWVLS